MPPLPLPRSALKRPTLTLAQSTNVLLAPPINPACPPDVLTALPQLIRRGTTNGTDEWPIHSGLTRGSGDAHTSLFAGAGTPHAETGVESRRDRRSSPAAPARGRAGGAATLAQILEDDGEEEHSSRVLWWATAAELLARARWEEGPSPEVAPRFWAVSVRPEAPPFRDHSIR